MYKRASVSEITFGEALRQAFPHLEIGQKVIAFRKFELSRQQASSALDELRPYFAAIERLYSWENGTATLGTENEIWSFLDPVSATTHLRDQAAIGLDQHSESVTQILKSFKSFGLYAHRVVLEDHLFGWLTEYATPNGFRTKSDLWLTSAISFHIAIYSALIEYIDNEIVLPMLGELSPEEYERQKDEDNRIFSHPELKQRTINGLLNYIEESYPRETLLKEHYEWAGGPISAGTVGGYLLSRQKDLKLLINGIIEYSMYSSMFYPRLTVAWTDPKLARLHRYCLKFFRVELSRLEIDRPFILTELSTNGAIQTNAISAKDILTMRGSEDIFVEWRQLVEDCIIQLKDSYAVGEQRESLMRRLIHEKEAVWQEKFKTLTETSNFFRRIANPRSSFLTSLGVGAAYGLAIKGDPLSTALLAGGGSAAKDAIIFLADIMLCGHGQTTRKALRGHFMAFGSQKDLF